MKVDPISWVLLAVGLAVGAAAGGGGVAAVHAVQNNRTALALAESQAAFAEQQSEQLRAALAPLQLEAESDANVYDKLTDEPPSCWLMRHAESREERDSLRLDCAVAMCWSYGLQAQQRPECQQLQQALVERASCVEAAP